MANDSLVAPKTFVLKLNHHCHCNGCERKLKSLLHKIHGVHSTSIDADTGHVTISGTVDPQKVIRVLEKNIKKVEIMLEEIPKMNNHNMQITTLPLQQPVQEFHDQNLVAQVQQFKDHVKGLKQLEVTYSKTVKVTFNGENKDDLSHENDAQKKIVVNDDRVHGHDQMHGNCGGGRGCAATSCSGDHVCHGGPTQPCGVHNSYGPNYGNYWPEGYYFPLPEPPPVPNYDPSAPPWTGGYSYPYAFGHEENSSRCIIL